MVSTGRCGQLSSEPRSHLLVNRWTQITADDYVGRCVIKTQPSDCLLPEQTVPGVTQSGWLLAISRG